MIILGKKYIFQNMIKRENGFSLPNSPLKLEQPSNKNGTNVWKEIG